MPSDPTERPGTRLAFLKSTYRPLAKLGYPPSKTAPRAGRALHKRACGQADTSSHCCVTQPTEPNRPQPAAARPQPNSARRHTSDIPTTPAARSFARGRAPSRCRCCSPTQLSAASPTHATAPRCCGCDPRPFLPSFPLQPLPLSPPPHDRAMYPWPMVMAHSTFSRSSSRDT